MSIALGTRIHARSPDLKDFPSGGGAGSKSNPCEGDSKVSGEDFCDCDIGHAFGRRLPDGNDNMRVIEAKVPFAIYFHDSKFDLCNQAVGYFGWAVYRKWESCDIRSYDIMKGLIQSEFPIFQKGATEYYAYNK